MVNELYATRPHPDETVLIGHPSGVMCVEARVSEKPDGCVVERATFVGLSLANPSIRKIGQWTL